MPGSPADPRLYRVDKSPLPTLLIIRQKAQAI
jgi:hypothetical protein